MRGRWALGLVLAVSLVTAITPGSTLAGSQPDPDLGDTVLGVVGDVRYAREVQPNQPGGYGYPTAGCGPDAFHLIGGGGKAGPAATTWLADASFRSYPESDTAMDDGFEQGVRGLVGGTSTAYAICIRDVESKVVHLDAASGASDLRGATVSCGARRWHPAGGAMFIATSGSWAGSSRPWDSGDAGTVPDDGWTGTAYDTVGGLGHLGITVGCIAGRPVRYVQGAARTVAPGATVTVTASCGADEQVVGGGQSMTGPARDTRAVASRPRDGSDANTIPENGWTAKVHNVGVATRKVRAWASCLG